ncbi:MAG: hypothetical protein P8O16_06520 [Algoriphagus sp.]|uniref:hypothetical protein n=1 Tax=Algoriphagus sp. TaxID=1872435 RepID=UPI0026076963|nr:hypothetical protein [Algoriphagus sp.]MDG1276919.1 hypothetical protein [Algoriphagus sp.]
MAKYKVLWFDDEWEELEEISENALDLDIELIGVSNASDGLSILQNDLMNYQGVILDGKFYMDSTKTGDEINDDAFGEVARFLHDIHTRGGVLPWFILSGQPTFVHEVNTSVKLLGISSYGNGKVFDKNKDEDKELFELLVQAIDAAPMLKAVMKHRLVFEACEESYLGNQKERLFEMIKNLELNGQKNSEDLFTPLRKILEKMIDRLVEFGVIADDLSLNDLKFFSKGKHKDYEFQGEIFPPLIAHLFNSVIDVIQDACHLKEDLRFKVDEFIKGSRTSYLYQSTTLTILDLIIWFKSYVDDLPSPEECKKKWSKISIEVNEKLGWIHGEINSVKDAWGSFISEDGTIRKSVPPYKMKGFQQGEIVRITLKEDNQDHIKDIEHA